MKELYQVEGNLNRGFIGQITYTVCLPDTYEELDIAFTFEKQHYPSPDAVPVEELASYCKKEYGLNFPDAETRTQTFFRESKTEIHLMATLSDAFIGGIHKQLTERHMHYTESSASEGCI